ncbi:MAG: leucyl/phenylalanyl-tRNA--protein transferase [Phycisphaerae bacterium]
MKPLRPDILISAYAQGIFPMGVEGEIRWFSPDPRAILPLGSFHASKTLRQKVRCGRFETRIDHRFRAVMEACGDRPEGTWITPDLVDAYTWLHKLGLAHSVESWHRGRLVGGLYGVTLGGAFFGESMFHRMRDASKVALAALVDRLKTRGYKLLDVQFLTPHLERFGAVEILREDYMRRLAGALDLKCAFSDGDESSV